MAYIEFHNISKIYRSGSNEVRALDGIDFELDQIEKIYDQICV